MTNYEFRNGLLVGILLGILSALTIVMIALLIN